MVRKKISVATDMMTKVETPVGLRVGLAVILGISAVVTCSMLIALWWMAKVLH